MSHKGNCPICEKPFLPDDDIVICPSCGAPYHRACYQKEGKCLFEAKHASGFEYSPPRPQAAPGAGPPFAAGYKEPPSGAKPASNGALCAACGTVNDASNIFCEHCGAPMHAGQTSSGTPFGGGAQPFGQMPFGSGGPAFGEAPFMDLAGNIEGIPKREWAAYIGPSAPVYLSRMSAQNLRGSKIGFMFSAFLVPSLYFAYRKVWGWAALAFASYLLITAPSLMLVMAEVKLPFMAGFSVQALEVAAAVATYLSVARQILFGLFGLTIYRKNAARRMRALRAAAESDAAYHEALPQKGGTSPWGIVAICVAYFALSALLYRFTGDALVNYMVSLLYLG